MAVTRAHVGVYEVTVDDTSVDKLLDKLTLAVGPISLEEFLRGPVSTHFEEEISARFDAQGDSKSGDWAPLSEATVAIREALGYGGDGPINVRTGELKAFVQTGREFLAADGWVEMQVPGSPPDPITAQKLQTAQRGAKTNPISNFGPTPPRPVLAWDAGDMATILEMLVIHIDAYLVLGGFTEGLGEAAA